MCVGGGGGTPRPSDIGPTNNIFIQVGAHVKRIHRGVAAKIDKCVVLNPMFRNRPTSLQITETSLHEHNVTLDISGHYVTVRSFTFSNISRRTFCYMVFFGRQTMIYFQTFTC